MQQPADLPCTWRERAAELEPYAAPAAEAFRRAAAELQAALDAAEAEALTLTQAAAESGYSADWLGRLVKEGKIPNAGRPNAPKILRRYLPRKATVLAEADGPGSRSTGTPTFSEIRRQAARSRNPSRRR